MRKVLNPASQTTTVGAEQIKAEASLSLYRPLCPGKWSERQALLYPRPCRTVTTTQGHRSVSCLTIYRAEEIAMLRNVIV